MFKFIFLSYFLPASQFIIWNVGQGQWITEVQKHSCLHYDLGGEHDPSLRVRKLCAQKLNILHLSHLDWDHISFARRFSGSVKKSCVVKPTSKFANSRKLQAIDSIPTCSIDQLQSSRQQTRKIFQPFKVKTSNESSEVFYSRDFRVLIPGDSPRSQEKYWLESVATGTQGLILGHHGSRTSTSENLLRSLPHLKWAVASARSARYGHPHQQVVRSLEEKKIPLLRTEDWGHLHFLQPEAF